MVRMLIDALVKLNENFRRWIWKQFTDEASKRTISRAVQILVSDHFNGNDVCIFILYILLILPFFSLFFCSVVLLIVLIVSHNIFAVIIQCIIIFILLKWIRIWKIVMRSWWRFFAIVRFYCKVIIKALNNTSKLKLSYLINRVFSIVILFALVKVKIRAASDDIVDMLLCVVEKLSDWLYFRLTPLIIIFIKEISVEVSKVIF